MLENRKILIAVIGYIIGILMGLYCKISIVPFYILIFLLYGIIKKKEKKKNFKLFSLKRYFRYVKIIFNKRVIKIIVIFSIISNTIVLIQNNQYENLYKNLDGKNCKFQGVVLSVAKDRAKVKIIDEKYKNTNLYMYSKNINFEYGDKITFEGTFARPEKRRNYKGFDKFEYYKTVKIYGSIKANKCNLISKNNGNIIKKYTNILSNKIKEKIEKTELLKDEKSLLVGILLGDKEEISDEIIENFSESNISHILAVSGMHIGYIVLAISFVFNKLIGKHYSKPICSIIILVYMCMVNFIPSVVRAGITAIIAIMANFVYRKNDIAESLSIAVFLILINNPFSVKDIGLQLSFLATIGIIVFGRTMKKIYCTKLDNVNRRAIRKNKKNTQKIVKLLNTKIAENIINASILTFSATITIIPIMALNFNRISILSLAISVIAGFLVAPIIIIGIIFVFIKFSFLELLLSLLLKMLLKISYIGGTCILNQIYVITPNIPIVLIYYICIFIINFILSINMKKNPSIFEQRVKDIFSVLKYKIKSNLKKVVSIILIVCILNVFYIFIPKNLKIHFVDVGQGDCTLIITPNNKTILIDGGGQENPLSDFNVGKSILMPYLLDRKIYVIDYVIFSHMDSDHAQGLLYILENMKVKNVVIGKQYEKSSNYEKFTEIVKQKKFNIKSVNAGDRINIEKKLYFDVLWPDENNMISQNSINNNSLVCKLVYKNFSMLFTGDIEEIAEKAILNLYKNRQDSLNAEFLKVAHHGSKTSSTLDFLTAVKPNFALIGVGKNNNFGHPSNLTLDHLEKLKCQIYRTDEMGEISIKSNGDWKKINYMNKK